MDAHCTRCDCSLKSVVGAHPATLMVAHAVRRVSLIPADLISHCITPCPSEGFLYPPGDYAAAASLTQRLVSDPKLRRQVGSAARREVEAWGWTASTNRLRTQQYRTAIDSYKSKHL